MSDRTDTFVRKMRFPTDTFRNFIGYHVVLFSSSAKSTKISPTRRQTAAGRTLVKQNFWEALPQDFETKQYNAIAALQGLPVKTAEKHVTAWCKSGQLVRVSQGKYRKNSES